MKYIDCTFPPNHIKGTPSLIRVSTLAIQDKNKMPWQRKQCKLKRKIETLGSHYLRHKESKFLTFSQPIQISTFRMKIPRNKKKLSWRFYLEHQISKLIQRILRRKSNNSKHIHTKSFALQMKLHSNNAAYNINNGNNNKRNIWRTQELHVQWERILPCPVRAIIPLFYFRVNHSSTSQTKLYTEIREEK